MSIKKMSKEELELLSNKDITNLLLEEKKIGDYYTSLTTDKRFILLDDGKWDLRSRHTSDKLVKIEDEEDDDEEEEEMEEEASDYDSIANDDESDLDDDEEDLKDLVILDEDEMDIE